MTGVLARPIAGPIAEALRARLEARTATIGIIGLGYAGLPLAVGFAEAGFAVIGVDLRADRRDAIAAGRSYVDDIADATLGPLVRAGRLRATADYAETELNKLVKTGQGVWEPIETTPAGGAPSRQFRLRDGGDWRHNPQKPAEN